MNFGMAHGFCLTLVVMLVSPAFGVDAGGKSEQEAERILSAAQRGEVDIARARQTPHPRSFADAGEWNVIRRALLEGERKQAFQRFLDGLAPLLQGGEVKAVPAFERGQGDEARIRGEFATKQHAERATRGAQALAFAALVTGRTAYIDAAKRHLLALARLEPRGPTGVAQEDLSARYVAWALALGLDWLYPHWTAFERGQLVAAIAPRMEDFAQRYVRGPQPLEKNPLDSHANAVLGALAEIGVLLAGETPLADRWMTEFIPLYSRLLTPFGGDDGGYANGTSYAFVDVSEGHLRHWDTLRRALGLDMTLKTWARNFGRYLVYFLPPGTAVGAFGDAAEQNSAQGWALTAKAYTARVPLPLYRWYARQWFQEDQQAIDLLLAPVLDNTPQGLPDGTPNSAYFPSIGWVAMHSDLRSRGRTSVYFKSSPYGVGSHEHYDQNSFVLNALGRPLLIDSGYYDMYGSSHHLGWTIRTKAHNAITFDGGQGQENEKKLNRDPDVTGKITQFETDGRVDMTAGNASASYGGRAEAHRAIIFDRGAGLVLVMDSLASLQPRTWEWNVHAVNRFQPVAGGGLEARNGDARACIDFRGSARTSFAQHDRFGFEPQRDAHNPRPAQWHGQFRTDAPSERFNSVAVISVGCGATPKADVRVENNAIVVRLGTVQYRFANDRVVRSVVE